MLFAKRISYKLKIDSKQTKKKKEEKESAGVAGRKDNEKGSWNKINNFWFCFHSFFVEKKG